MPHIIFWFMAVATFGAPLTKRFAFKFGYVFNMITRTARRDD